MIIKVLLMLSTICVVIILNVLGNWFIIRKLNRRFEAQKDKVDALSLYQKLGFVQIVLLSLGIAGSMTSILLVPLNDEVRRVILACIPLLYVIIVQLISQHLMYPVITKIRELEITRKQYFIGTLRSTLFIFGPIMLISFFGNQIFNSKFLSESLSYILYGLLLGLFLLFVPLILKWRLKATPLEGELLTILDKQLQQCGIKRVRLFKWPTKQRKVANAYVAGIFRTKNIYLSDYLIENLTVEEVKSIVIHEIGHIKQYHLIIRMLYIALGYGILYGILTFFDYLQINTFNFIFVLCLLFIFAYLGFLVVFYFKLSRLHEKQADAYVVKARVDKQILISALTKLYNLNHQARSQKGWLTKLSTHPTLEQRIKSIENIMIEIN